MMGRLSFSQVVSATSDDLLLRNADRFGENIDAIEADPGDVFEAGGGIDAGLVEGAVDDAEFHGLRRDGALHLRSQARQARLRANRADRARKSNHSFDLW